MYCEKKRMSQSLWDILGERIGDMNPSLLARLVTAFNNPEDRIDALLKYADDGFCYTRTDVYSKSQYRKKSDVMPSCRNQMNRRLRKYLHGRKSKTFQEDIEFILCKYNFP